MPKQIPSIERSELTKRALFLRYGEDAPPVNPPPHPLLSIRHVAELMEVKYDRVAHLMKAYFRPFRNQSNNRLSTLVPTMNARPQTKVLVTQANLIPEEHAFLCSQENQIKWAHLSLP